MSTEIANISNDISDNLTDKVVSGIESHLVSSKSLKKILAIAVEMTQNVQKYALSAENALATVVKDENAVIIQTCNSVNKEKVESLLKNIERINSTDPVELKQQYLVKMSDGSFNEQGGAGLGFFVMAMKSGNPIEANLSENNGNTILSLRVKINTD